MGKTLVDYGWMFDRGKYTVFFVHELGQPLDTLTVKLPEGRGGLFLWADGFLDKDSNYTLALSVWAADRTADTSLRYIPANVLATLAGTDMRVIKVDREKDQWADNACYLFTHLLCPAPQVRPSNGADLDSNHIEVIVDLSRYVHFGDSALSFDPITLVQKLPIPQSK